MRIGGVESAGGLVVDGDRAYVVAGEAPSAEVDLRTGRVTYHLDLPDPKLEDGDVLRARQRRAVLVRHGLIAVFGRELVMRAGRLHAVPAGVTLIDTNNWRACVLDDRASGATAAASRVLTYGPRLPVSRDEPGIGLHVYAPEGEEVLHVLDEEKVSDVDVVGGLAYVRTNASLRLVELASGKATGAVSPARDIAAVIG